MNPFYWCTSILFVQWTDNYLFLINNIYIYDYLIKYNFKNKSRILYIEFSFVFFMVHLSIYLGKWLETEAQHTRQINWTHLSNFEYFMSYRTVEMTGTVNLKIFRQMDKSDFAQIQPYLSNCSIFSLFYCTFICLNVSLLHILCSDNFLDF